MTPHHYGKLLDLLLDVKKDITEMKEDIAKNTVTLEDHARRSTASEKRHDLQEKKLEVFMDSLEPERDYIKFQKKSVKVVVMTLAAGASLAAIITLVLKMLA